MGISPTEKTLWVRYLTYKGLKEKEFGIDDQGRVHLKTDDKALDKDNDGLNDTPVDNVGLSDGLKKEEAQALGLKWKQIDHQTAQGWKRDGDDGVQTGPDASIIMPDEIRLMEGNVERYAHDFGISKDEAENFFFKFKLIPVGELRGTYNKLEQAKSVNVGLRQEPSPGNPEGGARVSLPPPLSADLLAAADAIIGAQIPDSAKARAGAVEKKEELKPSERPAQSEPVSIDGVYIEGEEDQSPKAIPITQPVKEPKLINLVMKISGKLESEYSIKILNGKNEQSDNIKVLGQLTFGDGKIGIKLSVKAGAELGNYSIRIVGERDAVLGKLEAAIVILSPE